MTVERLPLIKPPYATISAINLDQGEIVWQIAHGETPDDIKNNPALKGLNNSANRPIGLQHRHAGDEDACHRGRWRDDHAAVGRARGACCGLTTRLRARKSGAVMMPAPQSGSPMTYMVNGRQYIVIAVSGGPYSGEYLAFTLPAAE